MQDLHENSVTSIYILGIDFLTCIALMDGGVQWLLVTQDDSETRKRDTRHGWGAGEGRGPLDWGIFLP